MHRLSVVIIAGNAESDIEDCLSSVSFADEIIIVLSSTDSTRVIAQKHKAIIVDTQEKSFAEKRNIGFKKATGEWIFYIDTDERTTSELVTSIKDQVSSIKTEYSAFRIKRKNFYLGDTPWPKIEKLERVFRRDRLKGWFGDLHETAHFEGEIGELDGLLLHYTHKNLRQMLEKTIVWSDVEARLRYDAHHPAVYWWRFPRVMLTAFIDSYIKQGGWQVGTVGIIESIYQAFSIFVTYAKLWEMQQDKFQKTKFK